MKLHKDFRYNAYHGRRVRRNEVDSTLYFLKLPNLGRRKLRAPDTSKLPDLGRGSGMCPKDQQSDSQVRSCSPRWGGSRMNLADRNPSHLSSLLSCRTRAESYRQRLIRYQGGQLPVARASYPDSSRTFDDKSDLMWPGGVVIVLCPGQLASHSLQPRCLVAWFRVPICT